ncbi:MAG: hypothetical protein ACREEM_45915, partial [Blastocatellia bacterium]
MNAYRKTHPLLVAVMLALCITAQSPSASSLLIKAPPETVIWVGILRYGKVPASGEMTIRNLRSGGHTIRARLKGKREVTETVTLAASASQTAQLAFTAPADKAELSFQAAEELRERGKHADAIKEYRNAIKLRPGYTQARLAIARSMQ